MQRAGHQRPITIRATSTSPHAPGTTTVALRLVDPIADDDANRQLAQRQSLEIAIRERIESRLTGRVRNLAVRATAETVTLEGECSTFYTKQLAQHAAMGVLDDEQLDNAIVVRVPK